MKRISGTRVVLELDGNRLVALAATIKDGTVEPRAWLSVERPAAVAADDPQAVGEWAAAQFRDAGLPHAPAILSVSRGDVVLRDLALPAPKDGTDADLGAMVRLQMSRHLALPIDGTAIDYAPLPPSTSTTEPAIIPVIAGAMPANRVLWYRAFAKAAGLRLERLGLRCVGVASLLGPLSQTRAGTLVGVSLGWHSTELVIVEDGPMAFARSVDLPRPASPDEAAAFADKIAVEVKRAWIGYRATRPGPVPDLIAVPGEGDLPRLVAERCAAELQSTPRLVGAPPNASFPREMPQAERAAFAPLLGLLAQASSGRPTLDFANPRKPVDRAARARQVALAAAFVTLAVGGGLFTLAKQRLASIEARIEETETERATLTRDYAGFLAEHARLNHLQMWRQARVDWLAHVNLLCGQIPSGGVAYAEEIRGSGDSAPVFVPASKGVAYPAGEWKITPLALLDFKGRSPGRGVATDMRARLLEGDLYSVEIVGPDVTDRFALQLRSARLTPTPPPPPAPKPAETPKGGA
jgi:hypothetical protein